MSVTMIFGSFIAGASSEGGGAVAFPVMTLIFNIPAHVARNFGLAIQSVGMVAASCLIVMRRVKVAGSYLWLVSLGGIAGMLVGTYLLAPIVPPAFAKMLFVTFWLSFGIVLFYTNEIYKRKTSEHIPLLRPSEKFSMVLVGVFGGAVSALLGSGIDIFSFSYVTMRYHLSEKIATPTSVIIMAINSVVGFIVHALMIHDFDNESFHYWLVCIPVVIVGAPFGAYFITRRTRHFISRFLYVVILAQFIGALFIIRPHGTLLYFSAAVFVFGILVFFGFSWLSRWVKWLR